MSFAINDESTNLVKLEPKSLDESPQQDRDFMLVNMVLTEKRKYERNSNAIREILKKAYRNFQEIFDEPTTKYTNRTKEFWGLTRYHCLASAAKIYVDPKAINVLPRKEEQITSSKIWNALIPFQLSQINFFQAMNELSIDLTLFGTVVSAQEWDFEREVIFEEIDKNYFDKIMDLGKKLVGTDIKPKVKKVRVKNDKLSYKMIPLLNCYIDVTAPSIQKAPAFLVANWVEVSELENLKKKYKWSADVSGITGTRVITANATRDDRLLLFYAQQGVSQREMQVPLVQVIDRWGKIKLGWVTNKQEDMDTWVEGKITVLNQSTAQRDNNKAKLLDISLCQFKHGKRPFEECWYIKTPGSWYGTGVGQMLIAPNTYLNRVMNRRVDNNELMQNRMFKARRGSGLDNKTIAAAPGKVVTVTNMEDLQVLETGDAKQSSYDDEQVVLAWSERLTHIKDPSKRDNTATEAQIDDNISGEFFAIIRRNINDYLKRVVQQFIALDQQFIEQDMYIRIVGEPADFKDIDDLHGVPEENRADLGNVRFIKIDDINEIRGEYDVEVDIDNSVPVNKAFLSSSLEKVLAAARTDPDSGLNRRELYKDWVQSLGLKGQRYFLNTQNQSIVPLPGQQPTGQQPTPQLNGAQASPPQQGIQTNLSGIQANLPLR